MPEEIAIYEYDRKTKKGKDVQVLIQETIQFNSIQEAREVPWAPRSKWGTPSRSRLDQGFSPDIVKA